MKYLFSSMPYATFTKFIHKNGIINYEYPLSKNRTVDILFTGNTRRNVYRQTIIQNLQLRTFQNYSYFKALMTRNQKNFIKNSTILGVHLRFDECDLTNNLIKSFTWKINSKFCLVRSFRMFAY